MASAAPDERGKKWTFPGGCWTGEPPHSIPCITSTAVEGQVFIQFHSPLFLRGCLCCRRWHRHHRMVGHGSWWRKLSHYQTFNTRAVGESVFHSQESGFSLPSCHRQSGKEEDVWSPLLDLPDPCVPDSFHSLTKPNFWVDVRRMCGRLFFAFLIIVFQRSYVYWPNPNFCVRVSSS